MKKRPGWVDRNRAIQNAKPKIEVVTSRAIGDTDLENASKACRHNSTVASHWTLQRQQMVLSLHRDGWNVQEITACLREENRGEKIFEQQVTALTDRGIPHPRETAVHQCEECFRKIITDFCIACEIKKIKQLRPNKC